MTRTKFSEMPPEELLDRLRAQLQRVSELLDKEPPWEHAEARAQVARIRRRLPQRHQLQTEEERNGDVRGMCDD